VYKKNTASFEPVWKLSEGLSDQINLQLHHRNARVHLAIFHLLCSAAAASWKTVKWRGNTMDAKAGDLPTVDVIGVSNLGIESVLYTLNSSQQDFDISL
jgi:hypothetical protein